MRLGGGIFLDRGVSLKAFFKVFDEQRLNTVHCSVKIASMKNILRILFLSGVKSSQGKIANACGVILKRSCFT